MSQISNETAARGCPSHGRGRRFDPCIAHHFGANTKLLNLRGKMHRQRENAAISAPRISSTIQRTSAEHGTAARAHSGRVVLCLSFSRMATAAYSFVN